MVLTEFPEAQRNKQGDYGKALSRILLGEELALLFGRQREFGNPHAERELRGSDSWQRRPQERAVLGSRNPRWRAAIC